MVDTICSAKSNSGFDEYHQGAVASQQHAKILSNFLNTYCSIYDPGVLKSLGIEYFAIGRKPGK
jgi:hypothetical protein